MQSGRNDKAPSSWWPTSVSESNEKHNKVASEDRAHYTFSTVCVPCLLPLHALFFCPAINHRTLRMFHPIIMTLSKHESDGALLYAVR